MTRESGELTHTPRPSERAQGVMSKKISACYLQPRVACCVFSCLFSFSAYYMSTSRADPYVARKKRAKHLRTDPRTPTLTPENTTRRPR